MDKTPMDRLQAAISELATTAIKYGKSAVARNMYRLAGELRAVYNDLLTGQTEQIKIQTAAETELRDIKGRWWYRLATWRAWK